MTWMSDLYETYEKNINEVGKISLRGSQKFTLLPVGHAYQSANVEVVVSLEGEFYSAKVIEKSDAPTMIPVTEASASRTSGAVPHPLHDSLKYVAGDYYDFVETKKKKPTPFDLYITQLGGWENQAKNDRISAIYQYLTKKSLIHDLVEHHILFAENGELIKKWISKSDSKTDDKPDIFRVLPATQDKAFIRFTTHDTQKKFNESAVWEDNQIIKSAIDYFANDDEQKDLDYVTGEMKRRAESHPSGIRFGGDMAKLISSNDNINFTFRGRFTDKYEVASIGYEASQKIHNALKWLITKQGITKNGRTYLTWGNENYSVISPMLGANEIVINSFNTDDEDDEVKAVEEEDIDVTQNNFAKNFNKAIQGYRADLDTNAKINIIILDAATPGRMGVLYYNSINQNSYFERIKEWHQKSLWKHSYALNSERKHYIFWGAPNIEDIAKSAYGEKANEKILNNAMQTIFMCIVEGRTIPGNIVNQLFERASSPMSFDKNEQWLWNKTVSIACSMINNFYKGEYTVSLNKKNTERNYLFGRLLAVSEALENFALKNTEGAGRATNAKRYMVAYKAHPLKTWGIVHDNLIPYMIKLGGKSIYYEKIFSEIHGKFEDGDFVERPLDSRYLIGYYCQLEEIYGKKEEEK